MQGAVKRARADHNGRVILAYHIGIYTRSKDPPPIEDLLLDLNSGRPESKKKEINPQIALKQWAQVLDSLKV